jgi:hypothetical protein
VLYICLYPVSHAWQLDRAANGQGDEAIQIQVALVDLSRPSRRRWHLLRSDPGQHPWHCRIVFIHSIQRRPGYDDDLPMQHQLAATTCSVSECAVVGCGVERAGQLLLLPSLFVCVCDDAASSTEAEAPSRASARVRT